MDATMGSQMSYFFFDPKTQMQMNFHGLPISPLYSRPTSACSPQAPTLYSNAPAMSMGPMKPNMMLDTDFCNTLTLSGSALNSPAIDMLSANPMFSGIDTTEWVSGVSPPHTPSGFIQQSSTPSFTSCPSLSPSPSPVDTTEFLDPRNLTVSSASDLISTNDDIFKTEPEDSTSIESFDFNPSVPGMNFELENIDFNFDLPASLPSMSTTTTTTRPRASTSSSVVSLGLFESPDFQIAESAFDLINELEEPATKRARTSPEPAATSALSPAATEVISPSTSPATASATPSIPEAPVAVPEASSSFSTSTTTAATPIPAPASRRGRKQSLTEDPSKTFVCDLCNRRFRRQEHLKRHYRSLHTQEKPFECTDCGKKFSRSDNLAQHARTHGSGAIVMDLIDNHGYEPMLAGMAHAPTGDFSAYGKVLFQMPPEMMQAAVGGDEGKKKRKRSD